MKLLFIYPDLEIPPKRGYQVMLINHLRSLSIDNEVHLFLFYECDEKTYHELKKICKVIYFHKFTAGDIYSKIVSFFILNYPLQVSIFSSNKFKRKIANFISENNINLIFFGLVRMAQFYPENFKGISVLNLIDPLYLNYTKSRFHRTYFKRLFYMVEAKKIYRYEQKLIDKFNYLTLVSDADVKDYSTLYASNKFVRMRYGIDVNYFKNISQDKRDPNMILVTGNMNYAPNIWGVLWFAKEVYPLVRKIKPETKFFVVGSNPVKALMALDGRDNIYVTGGVPDVRAYLMRATVGICPIELDVGTQTKILEAMSMGLPLVTTAAGNIGIGAVSGEHILVALNRQDFADKIIRLLNGENWQVISVGSRKFICDHFSWDSGDKILGTFL